MESIRKTADAHEKRYQRFGVDTRKEKKSFFSGMNAESILKIIFEKGEKNNERKN